MKKTLIKLFTLVVACTLGFSLWAQDNTTTVVFDKTVHDFGTIYEKGGRVSYVFYFTNTGTEPIAIFSANPSCGCTTPEFGHEPIAAGQRGWVKAIYDPLNRPNTFDKTITVSTSGKPSAIVLHIKGVVVTAMVPVEEAYPVLLDNAVRVKSNAVNFAKVPGATMSSQAIDIVNVGKEAIDVTFDKLPNMMKAVVEPSKIEAGKTAKLILTIDPASAAKKQEGVYQATLTPLVNGKALAQGLTVNAVVEPDFSKLTPDQLAAAPVAETADLNYAFGTVKQGTAVSLEREIKNTGKTPLVIKATANNPLVKVSVSHATVKPGQTTKLKATMPTAKVSAGDVKFSVIVVTNAPKQAVLEYQVSGKVEK